MAYYPTSGQYGAAPYFNAQQWRIGEYMPGGYRYDEASDSIWKQNTPSSWGMVGGTQGVKKRSQPAQTAAPGNYGGTFMDSFNTILQSLMNPAQTANNAGANAFQSYLGGKNPFTMTAPANPYGAGTQNPSAQYTLDAMKAAVAPINVNTVDPSAVIAANLPKIQEMQENSFADAAARFGASGMGVSTPYAQALGDVSRKASNDIAALTEGYYYQSASDAAARQLQADLANRNNQLAVGGQWMGATESGLDRDLQAQMQSNQMFLDAAKAYGGFFDSGSGANTSALAGLAGQLAGLYGTSMENQAQRSWQAGENQADRSYSMWELGQTQGFQGEQAQAERDLKVQLTRMGYDDATAQRLATAALQSQQLGFTGQQNEADRKLQQALLEQTQRYQGGQNTADRALQQALLEQTQGFQGSQSALDRALQQAMQTQQFGFTGEQNTLDRQLQQALLGQTQGFQGQQSAYDRALQQMLQTQQLGSQQYLSQQQAQLQRELAAMGYSNEQAQRLATQMLQTQQLGFQGEQAGLDRTLQQAMQFQQFGNQQAMASQQAQLQRELAAMGYSDAAAQRLATQMLQQGAQGYEGQQAGLDRALQLQLAQMGYANQQGLNTSSQSQAMQLAALQAQLQKELAAMGYAADLGQNMWSSASRSGITNPRTLWGLTAGIGPYPWYAK